MRSASALVIRFARTAAPDKATTIQLTLAALEATLPEGDVQLNGRWTDPRTYEAVYGRPSQALYVIQGLQDAVRRLRFRAAVARGAHWSDVIQVEGADVVPHALSVARALSARLQPRDAVWVAFQGYGSWDEVATASFSVTCNIRNERSPWQREAEEAYRASGTIGGTSEILGVIPKTASLRLKRGHVQFVDNLDLTLSRQLDAAAAQTPT